MCIFCIFVYIIIYIQYVFCMSLLFLAEMVGGKRWDIFFMIRICRIKLTFHDVPGLIGTKLTGICPPAAGATGAELAERVDSGAWNLYKQFTQIHLGRSSKLLENRKELMGCSLSTNGLWIFLYCFCSSHVCSFSVLFSGMSCRWVSSCTSFARQYWHDLFRWAQHSAADAASIFSRAWCCSPPGKITYDDVTIDVFILQK